MDEAQYGRRVLRDWTLACDLAATARFALVLRYRLVRKVHQAFDVMAGLPCGNEAIVCLVFGRRYGSGMGPILQPTGECRSGRRFASFV